MDPVRVVKDVTWVGEFDPQLRIFDVIMRTEHGTTYNSYVVEGKDRIAVIDTVKEKFAGSYLDRLQSAVGLSKIDYLVLNHLESDHSGAVVRFKKAAPQAQIICTKMGAKILSQILHEDASPRIVSDGDRVDLGGLTLQFLSTPFLHWPDTMLTYLPERKVLFPCDFLASHFSDERLFDDEVDDFSNDFQYYFDCIMRPFKRFVRKALDKLEALDIDVVATSHGPILRTNVARYMDKYREWSREPEHMVPSVLIFYASAYGNTELMADAIAEGAKEVGAQVEVFDLVSTEPSSVLDKIEQADAVLVGSLTINADAVKPVWDLLSSLTTIHARGKVGGAFGSYAWSGEAPGLLQERMKGLRFKMPFEPIKATMIPDENALAECREFGRKIAREIGAGAETASASAS